MNTKLVKRLVEKWSQPGGLPGKGYELVREENGLSPCAQSEAIMLSRGIGVMDFQAFWKGLSTYGSSGLNLDKVTAKTLGISVVHSILLRRFNDLSSQNPAIVLNEPEKVLGENWDKVLEFWHFVSSLSQENLGNLLKQVESEKDAKRYESKKRDLKCLTNSLKVVTPDLFYTIESSVPLDPASVVRKTSEEVAKTIPGFKVSYSSNQHAPKCMPDVEWLELYPGDTAITKKMMVIGDYSRAYFGWIAPYDYVRSNFLSQVGSLDLQILLACATNEIQTLEKGQSYEDLYFCKILGYNPTRGNTLRKVQRKAREYKQSLLGNLSKIYRTMDNLVFSNLSKDAKVKQSPTKEMVEGLLELTEDDILSGESWDKIQRTYEVGKGRFFGTLQVKIPKLGLNSKADAHFYQLVERLRENSFDVWPLSFCVSVVSEPDSEEEGSVWAICSREERFKPRFNAPKLSQGKDC